MWGLVKRSVAKTLALRKPHQAAFVEAGCRSSWLPTPCRPSTTAPLQSCMPSSMEPRRWTQSSRQALFSSSARLLLQR